MHTQQHKNQLLLFKRLSNSLWIVNWQNHIFKQFVCIQNAKNSAAAAAVATATICIYYTDKDRVDAYYYVHYLLLAKFRKCTHLCTCQYIQCSRYPNYCYFGTLFYPFACECAAGRLRLLTCLAQASVPKKNKPIS